MNDENFRVAPDCIATRHRILAEWMTGSLPLLFRHDLDALLLAGLGMNCPWTRQWFGREVRILSVDRHCIILGAPRSTDALWSFELPKPRDLTDDQFHGALAAMVAGACRRFSSAEFVDVREQP